jgi:hypothetical protein
MSNDLWKKTVDFVVDEIADYYHQRLDAHRLHMVAAVYLRVMSASPPMHWPEERYVGAYLETSSTLFSGQREDLVQVYRVVRALVFGKLESRVADELELFLGQHSKRKLVEQPTVERPRRRPPVRTSKRSREA